MTESLVNVLIEFVVPKPNMVIRDRRTGKYGKVGWFQWKPETTKVPVELEDGTKDLVWVSAFNRRYEVLDPAADVYQTHLIQTKKSEELKDKQAKFAETLSVISTLEKNRREMHAPALRQALDAHINQLKDYRDELLRDIRDIRKSG